MLRIKQTATNQQQYVPLKKVTVQANIQTFAADVTIKQIFKNDESVPIEAVYCFPIEEQAAIYSFVAQIDDKQIVAQLKEKQQAQQIYNDALQQGHGAYLLEQHQQSQDQFIISIGALPPGKECHIQISYVTELDLVDNGQKIRFVIPTTIAPRYNPTQGGISSPADTTTAYVQSAPYTIDLQCKIDKNNVRRVSSLSHPIQIDLSQQDVYMVEFSQKETHLDRDILIDIELSEQRSNTILAVESNAVMASFLPSLEDCQKAMNASETNNEYMFVIDCSGSMEDENKIGYAREAMVLFLKSLPVNCAFNIIRFGSNYEKLFNDTTAIYNKENAQKAEQLIKSMKANLGGTELLPPLQWLDEHPSKQGYARQIFLLTDGEISNVDQVLDLCRTMSTSTRIFSFGLGRSPSRSLVKGLARATNGHYVFIPPDTNVDIYVGQQLEKALQPSITNIHIKWNLANTNIMSVPTTIPPIYANHRLIFYALTLQNDNASSIFNHNSSVELYNDKHRLGEAKVNRIPYVTPNEMLCRLAAKRLILELEHSKISINNRNGSKQARFEKQAREEREKQINEEKEDRKKRIIELSLRYNILSEYTGFVGIEKRLNGNNDEMVLREVPIQISADDQHLGGFRYQQMFYAAPQTLHDLSAPVLKDVYTDSIDACRFAADECCEMMSCNIDIDSFSPPSAAASVNYNYCNNSSIDDLLEEWATSSDSIVEKKEESFPVGDQDIVRYLINKQEFDGLWDLNSNEIEQLTGRPLSHFQQSTINSQVLISAIVIIVLETRFATLSSMWHGIVQKARKRLLDLLSNNNNELNTLFNDIRQQI